MAENIPAPANRVFPIWFTEGIEQIIAMIPIVYMRKYKVL
tara:strand:+ start:1130 stop:1249 length:120 start_codon:yes stop_codon:yes gene_type:complete